MEIKKYSSYEEIDRELEILKLEKEIHLQKIILNFQQTKEVLRPENLLIDFLGSCKTMVTNSYTKVLLTVLPYVIKWLRNKKRGN